MDTRKPCEEGKSLLMSNQIYKHHEMLLLSRETRLSADICLQMIYKVLTVPGKSWRRAGRREWCNGGRPACSPPPAPQRPLHGSPAEGSGSVWIWPVWRDWTQETKFLFSNLHWTKLCQDIIRGLFSCLGFLKSLDILSVTPTEAFV